MIATTLCARSDIKYVDDQPDVGVCIVVYVKYRVTFSLKYFILSVSDFLIMYDSAIWLSTPL